MARDGFTGKSDELIPTKDVLKVVREALALIGNASSYISTNRRMAIIDKVKVYRPRLASFLKEVCSEELGDAGGELFGPSAKKKLAERAETIKAFNEVLTKIDPPSKAGSSRSSTTEGHFWGEKLEHQVRQCFKLPIPKAVHKPSYLPTEPSKQVPSFQQVSASVQPTIQRATGRPVQRQLAPFARVGGRLAHFYNAWTRITNNSWILQTVKGYCLEFHKLPQDHFPLSQQSLSVEQQAALDKEVQDLLGKEAVEPIQTRDGFFSPLFVVPKKDGDGTQSSI